MEESELLERIRTYNLNPLMHDLLYFENKISMANRKKRSKSVFMAASILQYRKCGIIKINEFENAIAAATSIGGKADYIVWAAKEEYRYAYGFKWKFKDLDVAEN